MRHSFDRRKSSVRKPVMGIGTVHAADRIDLAIQAKNHISSVTAWPRGVARCVGMHHADARKPVNLRPVGLPNSVLGD